MRFLAAALWSCLAVVGVASCVLAGSTAQDRQFVNPQTQSDPQGLRPPVPSPKPNLSPEERADIYMARKQYREAIETYSRIQPLTAALWNKIGIAYQQQFEHQQARKSYERAIKLDKNCAEAINNLGTVHYMQRNYRRATKFYKRALKLRPQSAILYINLGMVWLARHNDREWQISFQRALELDPGVLDRRGGFGVMIEEQSTIERAKLDYYLARLQARRGNNELALQYLRKAMEAGFKDRQTLMEDADFAAVRKLPEFEELMNKPPKVL